MSGNSAIPAISYECPQCNQVYEPRSKSHALTAVCEKCGTYFGFAKWIKEEATFHETIIPVIPVYQKGMINGIVWQVLGFVVKRDKKYRSQWREYCMFNPAEGLAFLSEYNGHWIFIRPISKTPRKNASDSSFTYEGFEYNLFQKYSAEIVFAKGEFTFDIFGQADRNRNFEYIAPPYMLGLETNNTSRLWYKGEHIPASDVANAFKLPQRAMPPQSGVGAVQPVFNMGFSESAMMIACALLFAVVILIQFYFSSTSRNQIVLDATYYQSALQDKTDKVFVTQSFVLEGDMASATAKIKAPVDNDWFYADLVLVNETTGDEYNFSHEVAYYHGYDDGNWSEGSTVGEAFLSRIPGGTYHIVIYPQFNVASSFSLLITRDVDMPSNMFITILGITLFPIGYYLIKHRRDRKRWSESDYSPYQYDDD